METKGRYAVQKILRSVLLDGISAIGQTGWDVVEYGNDEFVNFNKVLTMQLLRQKRVGWQGWGYEYGDTGQGDALIRKDEWLTEYHWQVQVLMKRTDDITETSVVSEDIADMMISWLNGPGLAGIRSYGVAPLRIDESSVFVYNDNSDLYQKRAVFTVKIQVPKELGTGENVLAQIRPDVKPV